VEPGPEDEAAAERSIRDQVGGITAPSRGLSASSLQGTVLLFFLILALVHDRRTIFTTITTFASHSREAVERP
jgi:hypothetical protein